MHIITATSWNGSQYIYNVDRDRWDVTDEVNIGEAHRAEEGDLPMARSKAEAEGQLALSDSAILVDYDELLDDNS